MLTRIALTAARARLFRLAEEILSGRIQSVALTHRGWTDELLLVPASRIAALQSELDALRCRVAPEPRPLFGLATVHGPGSAADVIAELRADAARNADARLSEYAPAPEPARRVAEPKPRKPRTRSRGR